MNRFKLLVTSLTLFLALTGCQDYDGPLSTRDAAEVLKDFDFELIHPVALDIDYGSLSGRSIIEVYEDDPLAEATAEDQSPKGEPLYTTFLDEDGSFHGEMIIPTFVKHVYVYSPSWGTPMLKECNVVNNRVAVSNTPMTWTPANTLTRAGENYTIRELTSDEIDLNGGQNFYTMNGGWNAYGKTNNQNNLITQGTLTADEIKAIQFKLWNNTTKVSGSFDNRYLRVGHVNVKVLEKYIDENGDEQDVQDATVWFTMLSEAAWNENSFGYYFYPLGTEPNMATIKKYIILPNISINGHNPFGKKNNDYIFQDTEAPAYTNMRIKLLYEDAQGNVSDRFPPNTEVGFFLMSNAFADGSTVGNKITGSDGKTYDTRATGKIKYTADKFYNSNPTTKNLSRYIALSLPDNTLVYGVEDGANSKTGDYGDKSFEDMLFTVTANPNKAIKPHDDLPANNQVDPTQPMYATPTLYTRTYAFEDVWPEGGDYDLNDVVVEHKRTCTFDQNNNVTEVVDNFKVRSIADHTDGFAIQLKAANHGTMTLPQGAEWEEATGSIILTKQVQNGQNFTITRTFNGNGDMKKSTIEQEELNPYIINYTLTTDQNARIEVHLPGLRITSKGHKGNGGNDRYYVNETVKFPFAIRIPVGSFNLCPEGVRIDEYYPQYTNWTGSEGKNNTDWYKYPKQ